MLSDQAKKHRRQDMIAIETSVTVDQYIRIMVIGVSILARNFMNRLNDMQRFLLLVATTFAGGLLIYLFIKANMVGFALLVMFFVGALLAEIRHLG